MPGTIRIAQPCGCRQEHFMGQKRELTCEHGHLFEKPGTGSQRPRRRVASLRSKRGFEASAQQQAKVEGLVCAGCGREASDLVAIDPAHVWPRAKGGCDHEDCVVPLCRPKAFNPADLGCHRLLDDASKKFDLLKRLIGYESWSVELAHPILVHGVGPVELAERLTGDRYLPAREEMANA